LFRSPDERVLDWSTFYSVWGETTYSTSSRNVSDLYTRVLFIYSKEPMSKKISYLVGANVLVELLDVEEKTGGGIIMPTTTKTETDLVQGIVINKGPGFLLPFPKEHHDDVTALISGTQSSPVYLPLDVEKEDVVYFPKSSMEPIMLDGTQYYVVPYPAIKVFVREEVDAS